MKRHKVELTEIAAWDNLQLAALKAAKGKRFRSSVAAFFSNLDSNIERLQNDIFAHRVPYGNYRPFVIHDPKRRTIHAASFPDRVLHHAIMNRAEPLFENSLTDTTFACRPGKGVHRAVLQVQKKLQCHLWYAQVDIEHYFPSIDHVYLRNLLYRHFKGKDFLRLLERIIDSYHAAPGKGLPIGSLTSQHFANYYLNDADRFLLSHTAVEAHIRYMDDIVWWCKDKKDTKIVLQEFDDYLRATCRLKLKQQVRINRSNQGITYCGFRILPGIIRLPVRKQRRYRYLRQYYESAWQRGQIEDCELQKAYDAVLAATLPAHCETWRQQDLQLHPCLYDNAEG